MSAESGEQLVSFFLYSMLIYPITNYIVSPKRRYPKWKAALYAIGFLGLVSTIHLIYENMEKGPNHYQMLNVTRGSPIGVIKKAYRNLSLELHPDKNKSPGAAEEFQKVKGAFDVLVDKEKRREYDRLGDAGVAVLAHSVVDHKYIMIQLIVYYASSVIFAFLMTFSEPSGDALYVSLFGLAVMLLIECVLVLQEASLPVWLLPQHSSYDVVSTLHRLFPAFMNGCRCITGAFYVDKRELRVARLEALHSATKEVSVRIGGVVRALEFMVSDKLALPPNEDEFGDISATLLLTDDKDNDDTVTNTDTTGTAHRRRNKNPENIGLMARILADTVKRVSTSREGRKGTVAAMVKEDVQLISNPTKLSRSGRDSKASSWGSTFSWAQNLLIYLIVRYVYVKLKGTSNK